MTKTKFAGNTNPWTGASTKKPQQVIDPDALQVCDDPLPAQRCSPEGKYSRVFEQLKYGQCVKCPPGSAAKVATALRKWLENTKRSGVVRSATHYGEDGTGRVWLLEEQRKLKVA